MMLELVERGTRKSFGFFSSGREAREEKKRLKMNSVAVRIRFLGFISL